MSLDYAGAAGLGRALTAANAGGGGAGSTPSRGLMPYKARHKELAEPRTAGPRQAQPSPAAHHRSALVIL